MKRITACIGMTAGIALAPISSAQDHPHYEYYIDVSNGLDEPVAVRCNSGREYTLAPGDGRPVNLHGDDRLRVACEARDHHGQLLMRRVFDLDHHRNRASWFVDARGEAPRSDDER